MNANQTNNATAEFLELISEDGKQFQVFDNRTGEKVGKAVNSRAAARRKVDRLDQEFGAVRYGYKMVN